jgi:hypothetical protein
VYISNEKELEEFLSRSPQENTGVTLSNLQNWFSTLNPARFRTLCQALSQCKSLIIQDKLDNLNPTDLEKLKNVISECKGLTLLSLDGSNLYSLSLADFEAFVNVFPQCKALERIIFRNNNLDSLNLSSFETLGRALAQCKLLTSIAMRLNNLSNFNVAGFKALGNVLSQCKVLEEIVIGNEKLDELNFACIEAFMNALSQCKLLKILHITAAGINNFNVAGFKAFGNALSQCKMLHTISMSASNLATLNVVCLEALGNALSQCPALQTLLLANTNIGNLDDTHFEALCTGLEKSKTLLNLEGLAMTGLKPEQLRQLNEILNRHKLLHDSKFELKNKEPDIVPVIKDPEWLFYDSPKQIATFTANDADGDPELERLWQGHDTIYKKQVSEGRKRRTLILNDFTAKQWSTEKKAKIKQKLLSLILKGSDVYIYQDPVAIKLSEQNIDLLDSAEFSIPLVPNRKIDDLMQALNIPKKQIAYLDTPHLKELVGDNLPGLTIEELVQSGYPVDALKMHLTTEMPTTVVFNTVYSTTGSEDQRKTLNALKESIPVADRLVAITCFMSHKKENGGNLFLLLQKNADTLQQLTLSNNLNTPVSWDLESISKIKNLESFSTPLIIMRASIFISLLKNNPRLQTLFIETLTLSEEDETPEKILALKHLTSLKISCRIKKTLRNVILKSSDNLKILEFYGSSYDRLPPSYEEAISINDASALSLEHLEKLVFDGDLSITSEAFSRILAQSRGLKELCIKFGTKWSHFPENKPSHPLKAKDFPEGSLTKVKKLTVDAYAIESNDLTAILEKTISLEDLNIASLDTKITAETIPDHVLKNLKTVSFSRVDFNRTEISAIFKKMTKLENLNFGKFNRLPPFEHLPISMLENLKSIHIGYWEDYHDDLSLYISFCEHILKHAKKLNAEAREAIELQLEDAISNKQKKEKSEKQIALEKTKRQADVISANITDIPSPNLNISPLEQKSTAEKTEFSSTTKHSPTLSDSSPATNASLVWDADTSDKDQEFAVRQIFKGINCKDPSDHLYRLAIFDKVDITNNPNRPFALSNTSINEELVSCDPPVINLEPDFELKQESEFKYYKAKTPIIINKNEWTPLPSLSPREILTHLRLTSPSGTFKPDDYEIQYSNKNNLYYIKSKTAATNITANIEFILKKQKQPAVSELPESIKALVKKYRDYGVGKLELRVNPTGQEVLYALQNQKPGVGACRHRSVAFKKEVESLFSSEFPARIITNASHAFVEIQAKSGVWARYDLGGSPAKTHLFDENGDPITESTETEIEAESTAEANVGYSFKLTQNNDDDNVIISGYESAEAGARTEVDNTTPHAQIKEREVTEETKDVKEVEMPSIIHEIISEQELEENPLKTWEAHTKIPPKNDLNSYLLDIAQGTSPVTNSSLIKGDPLKKILVKLDSEEGTEAFRLLIQKQMLSLGKQVYYIHSPEDLVCSAPWTERNPKTNTGVLRPATFPPGEKLRKFLNAKHPNPALVVNWSNFKAEDIVKFNSLLDTKRKADGVDVPDNTLIVGLYTKKPGAYHGADFFSRSDAVITLAFNDDELVAEAKNLQESRHQPTIPTAEEVILAQKTDKKEQIIIDLYESPNWKGILLGKWCLQGKNLVFEQGLLETKLSEALETGKAIAFRNAPWALEEFRVFWQQARLHKKIEAYGQTIKIPDNFKVHTSEGYEWQELLENVRWQPTHEKSISVQQASTGSECYILNPTTFNQYFKNYHSMTGDQIMLKPGWIENAALEKRGYLPILLTCEISQHQWGQLLASAQKHQMTLNIRVAAGVSLPASFPEPVKKALAATPLIVHTTAPEETKVAASLAKATSFDKLDAGKSHVLMTEDIDYAIANLKDRYPKDKHHSLKHIKIIDISECEARHLLVSKTPIFNKKTLDYKFIQKISPVWAALEKGETIVLKGHFKEDLVDALASLCSDEPHFWLNGKRLTFPGKLVLVTDNQADTQKRFSFASPITLPSAKEDAELFALLERDAEKRYLPTFSRENIRSAIAAAKVIFEKLQQNSNAKKCTFVKLQSIVEHQLCYPNTNPDDNWQGLQSLKEPEEKVAETELSFNAKTADRQSNAFEQKRLNQINDALKHRPFVFIAGSTGVGKSTFIKKILAKKPGYKVFLDNQLQIWAADKTPNVNKTLFIDEANIDKGNFSAFEGLFETPPQILIGNTYYELTTQHKVIFAGNPLSYGSRQTPELFARHGGSVIFDPLSPAYLYSQVLKPILINCLTEKDQETVGNKLLHAYQHIGCLPSERILISPRELQMMALLVVKKHRETPQPPIEACIAYAVYMIGTGIIPENHKAGFNQWCMANGFEKPTLPVPPPPFVRPGTEQSTAFVVTKSRNPAYNQIMDFLSIRALKQENTANDTLKYAGLGGMVLEGEAGVGKSHFVIDTLVSQGFTEAHWKLSDAEPKEPASRWHKTTEQVRKPKNMTSQWRQDTTGQWRHTTQSSTSTEVTVTTQWCKETSAPQILPGIPPQKIFYIMPVSMQPEEKKKLLLKAFDEGALVVIDEINSCPMMEDLLNDLLMGIYGNKRPTHPGFMVIGTQNPISMEGRIAASTALERRLFKVIFPPYDPSEMKEILQNKCLPLADSEMLAEQYRKARQYAIQNNKIPMPTFRDLLKIAELKTEVLREKTLAKTKRTTEKKLDDPSEAQLHWLSNKQKKSAVLKESKSDKRPKPRTGLIT